MTKQNSMQKMPKQFMESICFHYSIIYDQYINVIQNQDNDICVQ